MAAYAPGILVDAAGTGYSAGMWRRIVIVCGLGMALCTGCQRATVDYAPETDFTAYPRFAWDPRRGAAEAAMEQTYPKLMDDIRLALTGELQARGFTPAPPEAADLLLVAHVELVPYETDSRGNPAPEGSELPAHKLGPLVIAPYAATPVDDDERERQLQEGTILLNMTDRRTGALLWQGWMNRLLDAAELRHVEWARDPDPAQVRYQHRLVRKAAARLLADFPPPYAPRLPPLPPPPTGVETP